MSQIEEFARVFNLPSGMIQYIDYVADQQERDLVLRLQGQALPADQIAEMLGLPPAEAEDYLKKACFKDILIRETDSGVALYRPSTFYHRLDSMAMYERWGDVPPEARDEAIRWQLQEFIDHWLPVLEEIQRDPDADVRIPNRDVLLLDEALEMVRAADEWAVALCDCRAIVMGCNRLPEACVRLNEGARRTLESGKGRRLTMDETVQLVIEADRQGLMHTGDRRWREQGTAFGLCSCCKCDCYPIRAGIALGMPRQFPRAWHVAERDESRCEHCGICTTRCHFKAFHFDGETVVVNGRRRRHVVFDAEQCWGCGLCQTGCRQSAITMRPLPAEQQASR